MKTLMELLNANGQVSNWKINIHAKESYELFFVKGKLETVRCTDTCDKEVTVYVDHGEYKGQAQFFVYPSTTPDQIASLIDEAVGKALIINNKFFTLPGAETGSFAVESNFADYDPAELAGVIAKTVFEANDVENGSLNSVEIFINRHTETVLNSRGLDKTQTRYDAMVEAIPTYNGETMSVELYEQYNFAALDEAVLRAEIAGKMAEVKARFEAVTPDFELNCPVVLNKLEVSNLFWNIAGEFDFATVYGHYNVFSKGDSVQSAPEGDKIGITMAGEAPGSIRSSKFDSDGLALTSRRIVEGGVGAAYYGSSRYGQYLGEEPTGALPCVIGDTGSADLSDLSDGTYLEVVSMSGLQVDFYSDYIGGEVRLAYYHDGGRVTPVTGISISGKLGDVLNHIRLSNRSCVHNGYTGPDKALLSGMKIF